MEALGRGGVLVNVGRGGLVGEPELVQCLREGVIGSAGLDCSDVSAELLAHGRTTSCCLASHRVVLTSESMCSNLDKKS
jgi:hydroxypyruvate reductase 2